MKNLNPIHPTTLKWIGDFLEGLFKFIKSFLLKLIVSFTAYLVFYVVFDSRMV